MTFQVPQRSLTTHSSLPTQTETPPVTISPRRSPRLSPINSNTFKFRYSFDVIKQRMETLMQGGEDNAELAIDRLLSMLRAGNVGSYTALQSDIGKSLRAKILEAGLKDVYDILEVAVEDLLLANQTPKVNMRDASENEINDSLTIEDALPYCHPAKNTVDGVLNYVIETMMSKVDTPSISEKSTWGLNKLEDLLFASPPYFGIPPALASSIYETFPVANTAAVVDDVDGVFGAAFGFYAELINVARNIHLVPFNSLEERWRSILEPLFVKAFADSEFLCMEDLVSIDATNDAIIKQKFTAFTNQRGMHPDLSIGYPRKPELTYKSNPRLLLKLEQDLREVLLDEAKTDVLLKEYQKQIYAPSTHSPSTPSPRRPTKKVKRDKYDSSNDETGLPIFTSVLATLENLPTTVETLPTTVETLPATVETLPATVEILPATVETLPTAGGSLPTTIGLAAIEPETLDDIWEQYISSSSSTAFVGNHIAFVEFEGIKNKTIAQAINQAALAGVVTQSVRRHVHKTNPTIPPIPIFGTNGPLAEIWALCSTVIPVKPISVVAHNLVKLRRYNLLHVNELWEWANAILNLRLITANYPTVITHKDEIAETVKESPHNVDNETQETEKTPGSGDTESSSHGSHTFYNEPQGTEKTPGSDDTESRFISHGSHTLQPMFDASNLVYPQYNASHATYYTWEKSSTTYSAVIKEGVRCDKLAVVGKFLPVATEAVQEAIILQHLAVGKHFVNIVDCFRQLSDTIVLVFPKLKPANPHNKKHALMLFCQVLEGVVFMHDQEIVHHDLASNNIMLDDNDVVKIIDCGVASFSTNNKCTHAPLILDGSVDYPQDVECSAAFDIYCLAVLYIRWVFCAHNMHSSDDDVKKIQMGSANSLFSSEEITTLSSMMHTNARCRPSSSVVLAEFTKQRNQI